MTTSTKRPAGRRAPVQFMRIVNVPMRAVLGLPFIWRAESEVSL
jgi:hypothetical protein